VIEVTSGALDQFSRQATSVTSLALTLATIIAIAAGVFLFVRYREAKRELREMRKGGGGGAGGEP
jgi:predicted RND superfamily exporter protein